MPSVVPGFNECWMGARGEVLVLLFFNRTGSGLAMLGLPERAAECIVGFLPSWRRRYDGYSDGCQVIYNPGARFPLGRRFHVGYQGVRILARLKVLFDFGVVLRQRALGDSRCSLSRLPAAVWDSIVVFLR